MKITCFKIQCPCLVLRLLPTCMSKHFCEYAWMLLWDQALPVGSALTYICPFDAWNYLFHSFHSYSPFRSWVQCHFLFYISFLKFFILVVFGSMLSKCCISELHCTLISFWKPFLTALHSVQGLQQPLIYTLPLRHFLHCSLVICFYGHSSASQWVTWGGRSSV